MFATATWWQRHGLGSCQTIEFRTSAVPRTISGRSGHSLGQNECMAESPMTRARLRASAYVAVGAAGAAALAVLAWGGLHTVREVMFHGFSPTCSDGHPEYDVRYCELAGGPSFLQLAAAVVVVVGVLAVGSLWLVRRRSTHVRPAGAENAQPAAHA